MTTDNGTWLVLLYVAADDLDPNKLDGGTIQDECNRMMRKLTRADIDPGVTIVALTDDNLRPKRPDVPDYMSPAIRVLKDHQWIEVGLDDEAELLFDRVNELREVDSGTPRTLALFLRWARRTYQTDYTMLSIIGHGGGWSDVVAPARNADDAVDDNLGGIGGGGSFQSKPGGGYSPSLNGLCSDSTARTAMSTPDLRRALEFGLGLKDNGKPLDVLFLDACLMGMLEVAYEIKDCADYLVAGESLLWAQLPYDIYLKSDNLATGTAPVDLARQIVQNYNSASGLVQKSWALAAINLHEIGNLAAKVNDLAADLIDRIGKQPEDTIRAIAKSYSSCQQFDDNADFRMDGKESYVDIFDFVTKLSKDIPDLAKQPAVLSDDGTAANDIVNFFDNASRQQREADDTETPPTATQRSTSARHKPDASKVTFATVAQTDRTLNEREPQVIDLTNSFGLSIYLPLGDIVDAADNVPVNHMLSATLARFAATRDSQSLVRLLNDMVNTLDKVSAKNVLDSQLKRYIAQLRFTRDSLAWPQLLNALRDSLENMPDAEREQLLSQSTDDAAPETGVVPPGAPVPAKKPTRFVKRASSTRIFNSPRQRT